MMARAASLALLFSLILPGCSRPARTADAIDSAEKKLLPARVRRLTNLEYERSVSALLGLPVSVAAALPPELRQDGYTPNAAQTSASSVAMDLDRLARRLSHDAVKQRLQELSPCHTRADRACAVEFVRSLGKKAYRRPLVPAEETLLLRVFDEGTSDSGGFAGGAALVLRTLLQSPSFLYVSELGAGGAPGDVVTLGAYEIASLLSYTVRGGPPDAELLAAAERGELADAGGRERQARRLLGQRDTRHHFRRFVLEWLEVDGLERTAKDAELFPEYEALKPAMLAETEAFVDEVMVHAGASVKALLGAGFASVEPQMARYYGLTTFGPRANLAGTGRSGVLQQASFLAAHAHEDSTSPVKRGDFVMRRLLCAPLQRPAELGIDLVIPAPSKSKTTRERFSAHVSDPSCAGCHRVLDPLGYAFENFDAAGRARREENGVRVNPSGSTDLFGPSVSFADSAGLTRLLIADPRVDECFARQAFRYFSAQADRGVEASFLELRDDLDAEQRGSVLEELVLFVKSDLFVQREVPSP
jgi:hypothetical protein